MSELVDEEKTCRDCRGAFMFTAGEQQFFQQMAYNPPVRCKACRDKRKTGVPAPRMERAASVQPPPREPYRPVRYEPEPEPDRRTKRQQHKGYRRNRHDEDDDYGGWR